MNFQELSNRERAVYFGQISGGEEPNIITNGTFDSTDYWLTNGTWSISGGTLNGGGAIDFQYTNYDANDDGGLANMITSGQSYRITADVVRNSGTLEFRYATTRIGNQIAATGAISFDFTASSNSYLRVYNAFSFNGSVDNIVLITI